MSQKNKAPPQKPSRKKALASAQVNQDQQRAKKLRLGPRPLPLYLSLAALQWLSWRSALPILKSDGPEFQNLEQSLRLLPEWADLRTTLQSLQQQDKNAAARLEDSLFDLTNQHYADFLSGVERYRASPSVRTLSDAPVIWHEGTTLLRDYGLDEDPANKFAVLVIPSLINRYHVLDLDEKQSLMRGLSARFHPYLIDWDAPGPDELGFDLDAYFGKRLLPILDFLCQRHDGPVHVLGYCMGGTLAVALAQLCPQQIKSLTCMAAPWDFHKGESHVKERMLALMTWLDPHLDGWGALPVDVLQSFFIHLQPFHLHDKFIRFAHEADEEALRRFVLVEDWVNEGVPLSRFVARDCLHGWYIDNTPFQKKWQVLGKIIDPVSSKTPSCHIIPQHDKIVPKASALALAHAMRGAEIIEPPYGHISMMTHAAARDELWPRLFDWLASQG